MEGGGLCIGDWDAAIKSGVRSRAQAFEATEDFKYAPKQYPLQPQSLPMEKK
jgi:hypothetical protein